MYQPDLPNADDDRERDLRAACRRVGPEQHHRAGLAGEPTSDVRSGDHDAELQADDQSDYNLF